jgi:hypothetical protein
MVTATMAKSLCWIALKRTNAVPDRREVKTTLDGENSKSGDTSAKTGTAISRS